MKIYLVGGAVRDKLLGLPVKERDWVVTGATVDDMLKLGFRQVGKEFPVFLHPKSGEEYALARMERKVQPGYTGFKFDTSPQVTLEEDLQRRDLTINAMAVPAEDEENIAKALIDPCHGMDDLNHKILRHVSPAFIEDPVRILRVGRFLARYASLGFQVAPETLALMREMVALGEVNALVAERVWKELERALAEKNPEKFFEVLAESHALPVLFAHLTMEGPGIKALKSASTPDTVVRFAALFYALPEAKKTIAELCNRYRIPNAYRELAQLTALYYEEALAARTLSAEALLHLFSALDIFRREDRFKKFLEACTAIAFSLGKTLDAQWLMDGAQAAKSCDVQALLAQGLQGNALAQQLKEKRREKIASWLGK